MDIFWQFMYEISMNLTWSSCPLICNCIRDHFWLIVTQSLESIPEFRFKLISSSSAVMGFFECFLRFISRETPELNPIISLLIQYFSSEIIVKTICCSSKWCYVFFEFFWSMSYKAYSMYKKCHSRGAKFVMELCICASLAWVANSSI